MKNKKKIPGEVSELIHHIEVRQRRSFISTSIGLLVACAIAAVIVFVSYSAVKNNLKELSTIKKRIEKLLMEEKSLRSSLKEYIVLDLEKNDINSLKSFLFEDRDLPLSQKELILFIFTGLTRNSFDLITIPTSLIPKVEMLVDNAIAKYPNDLSIQIEVTKTIRSLYWSSEPEQRKELLEKWRLSVEKLSEFKYQTPFEKTKVLRLSGLFYTITDPDQALEYFDEWYKIATPEEIYKIEFNRSRVYSSSKKKEYEPAIFHAKKSFELARDLEINFWQALYQVGYVYAKLNKFEKAASEFIVASEVAQEAGESELFEKYLKDLLSGNFLTDTQVEGLCGVSRFKRRFGKSCE